MKKGFADEKGVFFSVGYVTFKGPRLNVPTYILTLVNSKFSI